MARAFSGNEAAETFLNAAAAQAKGQSPIALQDYTAVIHEAGDWAVGQKEQFLGELSCQYVDTMYTDASWTDKYDDVFFEDSERFGSIVQIINTEMPEVRANRSWCEITEGTITIGQNVAYLPIVKEQLTGGSSSWAVPFALTGTMLDAAFRDVAGLKRFESYVQMAAENSVRYHLARMSAANRNNYIMEKISKGNSASKINVVNLVEEYCKMFGVASMTAANFWANKDGCLRSVNRIFKKYKAFLTDMTTLFSMDATTTGKFIPKDRFVMQVISDFSGLLESELYSTTYHDNFVTLKGYREVPAWQGIRWESGESHGILDRDVLTNIAAKNDESVIAVDKHAFVNTVGVVALMVDKWAIMHTIIKHRMGTQRDDIKDITLFEHQFTDRYINNLMLNGLVFIIADYGTAAKTKTSK